MLQLLWAKSKKVGCGVASNDIDVFYVVCNYDSSPCDSSNYKSNFPTLTINDIVEANEKGGALVGKKFFQNTIREMNLHDKDKVLYKKSK